MKNEITQGEWVVDDGAVGIDDQAQMLIDNMGTDREWVAIGINDAEGFAEVVALAHPSNAKAIAAVPKLIAGLRSAEAWLERMMEKHDDYSRGPSDALTKVREALKKAGVLA